MLQSNISLKISLLIYCAIGIVCATIAIFFVLVYRFGHQILPVSPEVPVAVPVGDIIPPDIIVKDLSVGLPLRLMIPKINLDASIEYVGLTSIGAMDTPKTATDVGWFQLGPRPGAAGSAVIAGHYGLKGNKPAAFDNLHSLRVNDKISIQDNEGTLISFVVREIIRFDPKADATTVFSSTDGKAHLNLITCEGIWDRTAKDYPKRLVVFADKE